MSGLRVENLTIKTETPSLLVDSLNFELPAGSRLGLLGESGSGKSLTSLAITSLLDPNLKVSGSIYYGAMDLMEASESELCKIRGSGIGIVFQDPLTSLDPVMKIGNQIRKPLSRYQGLKGDELTAAVEAALSEVKITSPYRVAHSYPHEISGGERQRVALALALACLPKILIADEITTSLDVSVQAEIIALLENIISERKMSLIFITHDIAVASMIVDKVIILRNGAIVESGNLEQVLKSPKSPYAAALIKSARSLDNALSKVRGGKNL
jgi:peptide/nickel transport system ATP-binding protein